MGRLGPGCSMRSVSLARGGKKDVRRLVLGSTVGGALSTLLLFLFPLSAVPGRRQNTIVVKVPGQEDSHNEDGESGSEASDSVSTCGQSGSQNIGNNVTLITLNSEGAPAEPCLPFA